MPRLGSLQPPAQGESRRSTLALLGALCLFLTAIEYLIPRPLPFLRVGLANMPLLLALKVLGARDFFLLALIKVMGQGILGGTFLSFVFLFSIAGTFASAAVMYALGSLPEKMRPGFAGIGCAGAMVSNGAQLLLARHMLFGEAARYLAPPFLAIGFFSGIGLGLICEYFCRRSKWYESRAGGKSLPAPEGGPPAETGAALFPSAAPAPRAYLRRLLSAEELFVAGLLMALVFLHDRSLPGHAAQFLFFCLLARLSGKRNNPIATLAFFAGIVFFSLLAPHGRVLLAIGPLQVTQGSLLAGLERAFTLSGLLMLSRACVRSDLRLPGAAGSLLAESLRMLELMRGKKIKLFRRGAGWQNAAAQIDAMMIETEAAHIGGLGASGEKARRGIKGIPALCAAALLTAAIGWAARLAPLPFLG